MADVDTNGFVGSICFVCSFYHLVANCDGWVLSRIRNTTERRSGMLDTAAQPEHNYCTFNSFTKHNIYIYIQYTLPFQTLEVLKGVLMIYWIGPTIKFNAKANLSTPPMFGLGTLARSPACRWPISWRSWKKIRCSWVSCTA